MYIPFLIFHFSPLLTPAVEGKAGMAAIADTTGRFDCNSFLQKIQRALPSYARPVFLRISPHVDTTGMHTVASLLNFPNDEISEDHTSTHYLLCVHLLVPVQVHLKSRKPGCRGRGMTPVSRLIKSMF